MVGQNKGKKKKEETNKQTNKQEYKRKTEIHKVDLAQHLTLKLLFHDTN